MGYPSIYPTGVTIYNPEKSWNGYTIFQAPDVGAILIDMNGTEVQVWKGINGFPNKLLPGGYVLSSTGERNPKYGVQDMLDISQIDWEGNIVWQFNHNEFIKDSGEDPQWIARAHHDYQREGNPVGYYAPDLEPRVDGGNSVILVHENVTNTAISDKPLLDDKIIEVNWSGDIIWQWKASDHFEELGFDKAAKDSIYGNPGSRLDGDGIGDWLHINSVSLLGPNKWFDAGDKRFNPENIVWDSREANIIAIIEKESGKIVWRLGPSYDSSKELEELGWIIGQHHAHLIPKGLPGEGNLLVFDNGGWAGYGAPNSFSKTGNQSIRRDFSRILEIDPIKLEIIWQYTPKEAGLVHPLNSYRFYSPFISSAQRLPNGNTLITEGSNGRIFEITAQHEIVWEYISPYDISRAPKFNMVYRAYRAPYDWVPQLEKPVEVPVEKIDVKNFRVPGDAGRGRLKETEVRGARSYQKDSAFCVVSNSGKEKE